METADIGKQPFSVIKRKQFFSVVAEITLRHEGWWYLNFGGKCHVFRCIHIEI
jgi:hypothetical protein